MFLPCFQCYENCPWDQSEMVQKGKICNILKICVGLQGGSYPVITSHLIFTSVPSQTDFLNQWYLWICVLYPVKQHLSFSVMSIFLYIFCFLKKKSIPLIGGGGCYENTVLKEFRASSELFSMKLPLPWVFMLHICLMQNCLLKKKEKKKRKFQQSC